MAHGLTKATSLSVYDEGSMYLKVDPVMLAGCLPLLLSDRMEDESDCVGREREIRVVLKSGERALAAFNVGACIQIKCRLKSEASQDRDV